MKCLIFETLNFRNVIYIFFCDYEKLLFFNFQNVFVKFIYKIFLFKKIKKINFSFSNLFDKNNKHFNTKIDYDELINLSQLIFSNQKFNSKNIYFKFYFEKEVSLNYYNNFQYKNSLLCLSILINYVLEYSKNSNYVTNFILEDRNFKREIKKFYDSKNLQINFKNFINIFKIIKSLIKKILLFFLKNIKKKKTNFKKNILNFEKLIIIDSDIEYVNNTNFWNNIKILLCFSYSRKDIIENLDKNFDYISLDFFIKIIY